ncbi:hypothetical protein [Chishuiella sp.]|uniref:hypothetical protein n=1 Tax=Chishuiella sp. TaxID=1969467 RepID=UPI0028AC0B1B|nr:hypothetical protein [Chishuiella sp.]
MKKLTLLVAIAALATSCNFKASGNHGVIELEHEPATAEEMHHKVEHAEHEEHEEHVEAEEVHKEEVKDSTKVATEEAATVKENTEKADH